jgi:NTE family protein
MPLMYRKPASILILLLLTCNLCFSQTQKVGVVLSGGGALGLAHIGVLKALEENNIPIDYITGTSMGALIGSLYAAGFTPWQIDSLFNTEEFKNNAKGIIDDKLIFNYRRKDNNASWIEIKFSPNSLLESSLPTNLISPIPIEYSLLEGLSGVSAAANYNFDSLFIPFRCVAADIVNKKQVIYRSGALNEAVRASISYPFYLKPVINDSIMLIDGGVYNNFPSDIMYQDFDPDIIIGSNVNIKRTERMPDDDNLIAQLKTMLIYRQNYDLNCHGGILIEPEVNVSLFDFSNPSPSIQAGYDATIAMMDSIKTAVVSRISKEELAQKRKQFQQKIPEVKISNIYFTGLNKKQEKYARRLLTLNKSEITFDDLKLRYFRLVSDDKIKHIVPTTIYNPKTGKFDLNLRVKKERELTAEFGGNVSNKPINSGYIGIQYNYLGAAAITLLANTYFGRLYSSGHLKARFDFPYRVPFFAEAFITLNQFDFFRSSNAFFENRKPSYLIQNENFGEISVGVPVFNKGRFKIGYSYAALKNSYYQTPDFSENDTIDFTTFNLIRGYMLFDHYSLNRKLYASEGSMFKLKVYTLEGEEFTKPGSTALNRLPNRKIHTWNTAILHYEKYFNKKGKVKPGLLLEGVYSNQPKFSNYTATILSAPAFTPTPESQTLFLEKFRAFSYMAGGVRNIIAIRKSLELRLEGYIFQPYEEIQKNPDFTANIGKPFSNRFFMASSAIVLNSPVGPLCFSVNYYDKEPQPFSFLFHFGYILFNKRAME